MFRVFRGLSSTAWSGLRVEVARVAAPTAVDAADEALILEWEVAHLAATGVGLLSGKDALLTSVLVDGKRLLALSTSGSKRMREAATLLDAR